MNNHQINLNNWFQLHNNLWCRINQFMWDARFLFLLLSQVVIPMSRQLWGHFHKNMTLSFPDGFPFSCFAGTFWMSAVSLIPHALTQIHTHTVSWVSHQNRVKSDLFPRNHHSPPPSGTRIASRASLHWVQRRDSLDLSLFIAWVKPLSKSN